MMNAAQIALEVLFVCMLVTPWYAGVVMIREAARKAKQAHGETVKGSEVKQAEAPVPAMQVQQAQVPTPVVSGNAGGNHAVHLPTGQTLVVVPVVIENPYRRSYGRRSGEGKTGK